MQGLLAIKGVEAAPAVYSRSYRKARKATYRQRRVEQGKHGPPEDYHLPRRDMAAFEDKLHTRRDVITAFSIASVQLGRSVIPHIRYTHPYSCTDNMGHIMSRLRRQHSERKVHGATADEDGNRLTTTQEPSLPREGDLRTSKNHPQSKDGSALHASNDPYTGLSECSIPPPVQNRDDSAPTYSHRTLDDNMQGLSTR